MTLYDAAADPRQIIADLERKLAESAAQHAATAEILKVINSSPNDLAPVFDAILEKAHSLCDVTTGSLELYEGDIARSVAARGMNPRWEQYLRHGYKITETIRPAYMALAHTHIVDMAKSVERFPNEPIMRDFVDVGGLRTFLGLALAKDGKVFGRIIAAREEVRPFTEQQIALLQSFADQAVIAIENARLLTEQREALDRQTATANILEVIGSSVSDTTPVFEKILDSCERLTAFTRMAIFLLDDDGQVQVGASRGGDGGALKATFPQPLANTPMSLAFARQRALFFGDVLDNPDAPESLRIAASRMGSFSVLVAPLLWEGRGIGAFHVARDAHATFSEKEVSLLKTFADQAAIAIQNARLFNETKEALERQTATSDVLKVIARSRDDVQPVFQAIAERSNRLVNGRSTTVLSIIDDAIHLSAFTKTTQDADDQLTASFPRKLSTQPYGAPIQRGEIYRVPDTDAEPALRDVARLRGYRSIVFVPLLHDGIAIGMIGQSKVERGPFPENHIRLLQTFADQAVIAIQNARLFNETKESLQQQTATADVLKVISRSAFDLDAVFQTLLESAVNLCDARLAVLFRKEGDVLRVGASHAGDGDGRKMIEYLQANPHPIDRSSIAGRAAVEKRTVHVPDIDADPEYRPRVVATLGDWRSIIGVPLMRDGEPIGVLTLSRPGEFNKRAIDLVETFADQAMIAIENVRLFNEVQAKTRDLEESLERQTATSDVLQVISSSVSDAAPVFEKILDSCERLIPCTDLAVLTIESDDLVHLGLARGEYGLRVAKNFRPTPVDQTIIADAVAQLRTIHVNDGMNGESVPFVLRRMTEKLGQNMSCVIAPMRWQGGAVGALFVARVYGTAFTENEIALFEIFADQAVIAIQNARLFNETREALEQQTATADILKVIASSPSDVQPVFQAIADRSNRLVNGLSTAVFTLVGEMVHLAAFTKIDPAADTALKAIFPAPLSDFSWSAVVRRGETHCLPDTEDVDGVRDVARLRGFRSMLMVPLQRDGEQIGLISQTRREPGPFNENHVQLLQTFADQAVIAIQNAQLFKEIREALEQQTATADILKVIASSPNDVQPVFQAIAERSNLLLSGYGTSVFSIVDDVMHLRGYDNNGADIPDEMRRAFPLRLSVGEWGRQILSGEVSNISDTEHSSVLPWLREAARRRGYRSMLWVPLRHEGKSIGLIAVSRQQPSSFGDRHIQLLQTFADQAVIAISNVGLFQEVQERTKELSASLDHLRTAQDRLVQTEKLASLGQLTAGIAHEIKNPLNFINNFAALSSELIGELNDALTPAALDEKTREEIDELTEMLRGNLEKVVQHGKRADSIVKNMLLHSREGSGEQRLADINAIVEESLNLAYHGARAEKPGFNITLNRDFDPAAGQIDLYPQEMTRVFLNLISNGFYAAAKRKESGDAGFEPVLSAVTKNLGNEVEIRIRDNGTGIPAAVKEKMFNPFFTTKPAGEGTGLGLSMSHDIVVNQHGGTIDVTTEPGSFTEFTITLPRTGAANPISRGGN